MHSTAHKSVAPPINQPWNMCVSLGYFPLHTLATSRNPVIRPVLVRNNRATRPTTGKLKRFFSGMGGCASGAGLVPVCWPACMQYHAAGVGQRASGMRPRHRSSRYGCWRC